MFDDSRNEFARARDQLTGLLTPEELAAAARSTLNAHYTDAALVQPMWAAATRLGFDGGAGPRTRLRHRQLHRLRPATAQMTGVELEPVTAGIAAALYPTARIIRGSFAATRLPEDSFDLVHRQRAVRQRRPSRPRHNRSGHSIHNHFILKSLHLTRPGGLVMVLTSRYTMDARNPAARREIAALADLVGALRLPSRAHQRAAGTGVVTDLLILRRREPGREPDPTAWEQARLTELDGAQVPVNEYFLDHPESGARHSSARSNGAYRADDLVVTATADTIERVHRRPDRITASAAARGLTWAPPAHRPSPPAEATCSPHPDGYLQARDDGTFTEVADGMARPFEVPRSQAAELRALLGLRDTAVALLQARPAQQKTPPIQRLRRQLTPHYDSYVRGYGPLNRFTLRGPGAPTR